MELPAITWLVIPLALMPLGLYIRSLYQEREKKRRGIGRGVAGFQTGVKRLAVPPEIAERLKRGENVSAEEITAAAEAAAGGRGAESRAPVKTYASSHKASSSTTTPKLAPPVTNDWVPEHLQQNRNRKKKIAGGREKLDETSS